MKNKIFDKVNECLERYIGGEAFFDELDRMIKFDKDILTEFMENVKMQNLHTIASGELGLCLHNYGFPVDILVQGGLRKGNKISDLSHFIIEGEKYLFLDDSYFSGKTAQVVKEEVERCGGKFECCYVIYDGSQHPMHPVHSMYRYYNHYDILGRKLE